MSTQVSCLLLDRSITRSQGYELLLRSTERGVPLNVDFTDPKVTLAGAAGQTASASTITVNLLVKLKQVIN